MYFLVYAIFMCELQKIFFLRDMMDNQCANIFSTHAFVYGSHSVKFTFIGRENFFFLSVSSTYVSFSFSPPPKFFPKHVFFFFPIFIGGTFVVLRGSYCSS